MSGYQELFKFKIIYFKTGILLRPFACEELNIKFYL